MYPSLHRNLTLTLLAASLLAAGTAALSAADVALTWQDNSNNESGFRLQRRVGASGAWLTLNTTLPDATSYLDTAVAPGTSYSYRVLAFNAAGDSAWSNTATVTLPAGETVPNPPGTLNVELKFPGRLVNLSARAPVRLADQIVIGGFVVENEPLTILVRAVGPGLAQFGVPGVLTDPHLQIIGGPANDNWSGADVSAAAVRVNAFPLDPGSKDAALLVTLPPGQYTAHVTGVNGATGIVLLETYLVATP